MRSFWVETNRSCPLRCRHCRCSTREDPAVVRAAPRAIADAAAQGFASLTLAGGEPTLRRDLERLIAFAKRGAGRAGQLGPGAKQGEVTIATSAIGIDHARARALAEAGLDRARVRVPGWGADYDRIVGVAGAFERARRGMDALADAGIALDLELAIVASNLDAVAEIPARAIADGLRPESLERIHLLLPTHDPDPPGLREAAAAIEACDAAIAKLEVDVQARLADGRMPPPCLFRSPSRSGHLFAFNRGSGTRAGHRRLPGCEPCQLRERCPGFPESDLARDASVGPQPIADDRVVRRLTLIGGVQQQIERELVSQDLGRDIDGETWVVHTIRVQFRCNQACDFCFVSTHLPNPRDAAIVAAIDAAADQGVAIALSGGEPTLNPKLVDYVRHAKARGVRGIELQTNAIRLADPERCRALAEAGIDSAFVSLHGASAAVCDAITNAPGTWVKTVAGLDQLAAVGVATRVNFVLCQGNAEDFPNVVDLVADRWPGFLLTFSFVAPSTDLVPRTRALIPRYSEVAGPLLEGLARARARSVTVTGFESMCAIPLCLKPDGLGEYAALSDVAPELGSSASEFEKPPVCQSCSQRARCWGVRRGYVALYGTAELRPYPHTDPGAEPHTDPGAEPHADPGAEPHAEGTPP